MQVTCAQCGAKYSLSEQKIADHAKVQFRCAKCGHTTVVDVTVHPDRTQPTTPLPAFARAESAPEVGTTVVSQYEGLSLPADKIVTLSVISGPSKGLTHQMEKPRVVLGRTGADIEINDPEISRWHCAIEVKQDVVRLRDLDSTNGTYINDERVRGAELEHLSEFRIGSTNVLLTITTKHE